MTDDITYQKQEAVLERKKRVLRRWAIAIGILAFLALFGLGGMILDRILKGGADGALEINYNKVDKKLAWLGSEIQDLNTTVSKSLGLTSTDGVLVSSVAKDSPADDAGLERGDVILAVNETEVVDTFQMQGMMLELAPGDMARLVVDKINGGTANIYVELGAKASDTPAEQDSSIVKVADETTKPAPAPQMSRPWGISVSSLTNDLREQFSIPVLEQGVVVVTVVQGSLADQQGIEVGDVIESINQVPTPNLQSLYLALQDNENVLMDVFSPVDDKRLFITLPDEGDSPPQAVLVSFAEETLAKNRIVVPSDSPNLNGAVFYRFASSPYFILYDFNKSEMAVIENPYAAQVRGMGITVAQMLIEQKIDAVIVSAIGPQSFDSFYLAKVKVYGPVTGAVRDAIRKYQSDKLPELKEANLGGYGYSSTATIPTGSSPWTEDEEDEDDEEDGLQGQPSVIPPKGKPADLTLTASEARSNRPDVCLCPNCGAEVTHPSSVSCSEMVCPICGSQLMTASPGSDSGGSTDPTAQVPTTDIATQIPATNLRPIALTAGAPPDRISAIPVANDLWAIGGKPDDVPPVQQTAGSAANANTNTNSTTQVATCVCPLDGTTVVHPVGIPCAALQCPLCGGRMVNGSNVILPVAGGPPTDDSDMGSSSAGSAVDGQSQGGGQASAGAAQSGRSTECICPMCQTRVTHPIGVPCTSLTCPVCGSRLVNAEPGGSSAGAAIQTGGKPDDVPPVQQVLYIPVVGGAPITTVSSQPALSQGSIQGQQVAYVPVAGGPPTDGSDMGPSSAGPAVDGQSQGGGQASTGSAQSGRSDLCICPMCSTTVTHPIGVPCSSLTCPVCGSRLVNAEPGGATGGAAMTTAAVTVAGQSQVVQVSSSSKSVVVPSNGRSLKSDVASMLDEARYFIMFSLGSYEVVPNPYYRDKRATGTEMAQFIVAEGGAVVICNNVSMTALKTFKDLKVKVYTGFTGSVQQVIDIYADGRLKDSVSSGIVLEDDEEHVGGGGPPSSKDKKKEKEETEVF